MGDTFNLSATGQSFLPS